MNVIAWELGGKITDYPKGVHWMLAKMVQHVNDAIASAYGVRVRVDGGTYVREVPARFSGKLLDIAHMTIETDPERMGHRSLQDARLNAEFYKMSKAIQSTAYDWRKHRSNQLTLDRYDMNVSPPDDAEAYALLRKLEEFVIASRITLGLSPTPVTAPSVNVVNEALRKMREVKA